ncbi:hypothetical protein NGRA_0907 [Nosema granulosis]|uniref:Uncharacterized protein n=1 Tax=Nosema granulosis TaxID=83296 RepID=A0A9P6KZP5_9MICR|nr:hypothetical protein NGRA_0907 [Nosema granulosis]
MAQKGISRSKQTHKIVANEPSNIFEYSMIQRKPVRVVDFNELVSSSKQKIAEESQKRVKRRKKAEARKFVNFDDLIKKDITSNLDTNTKGTIDKDISLDLKTEPVSEIAKPIPNKPEIATKLPHRTFSARVLSTLNDQSTINDLIKSYVVEKQKRSKSLYLENLKDKLFIDNVTIEDIDLEKEVTNLDLQIEEINKQDQLWKEIKENVSKENSFSTTSLEDLCNRYKKCINKDFRTQLDEEILKVDRKIKEKLARLEFLKDSVSLNIKNIKTKVDEEEKKIFNLTENGSDLDTMVLLKAITRSK